MGPISWFILYSYMLKINDRIFKYFDERLDKTEGIHAHQLSQAMEPFNTLRNYTDTVVSGYDPDRRDDDTEAAIDQGMI